MSSSQGYSLVKIQSPRENQPDLPCPKGEGFFPLAHQRDPSAPLHSLFAPGKLTFRISQITENLWPTVFPSVNWMSKNNQVKLPCLWGRRTPFPLLSHSVLLKSPFPMCSTLASDSLYRANPHTLQTCWDAFLMLAISYLTSFSSHLFFFLCSYGSTHHLDLQAGYIPT